jgi:hypothetical protein
MSEVSEREPIRILNEVPKSEAPELRVIRLKGSQVMHCIVLSSRVWGVTIHYDHTINRSEPCLLDPAKCPGCQVKKPVKDLFYLHVFSNAHGQCFIELTRSAMEKVQNLCNGLPTMRGEVIEFRRTPADNGRMLVRPSESMSRRENLPREKDPEDTLRMLWQWGRK